VLRACRHRIGSRHAPARLHLVRELIGAGAQLIVGKSATGVDWGLALAAGIVGSFVGGLIISLISGEGLAFRPSGIIGSLAGAIIVTLAWHWWRARRAEPKR
jgi:uncharacterized membrane protein YeaQ/YmgE (transglycosylase-associated protein family)